MKTQVKFMVIYRHRAKHKITAMCEYFGISRSGYYCFVKRMDKPAKDTALAEMISECQSETKRTYGYRRVQMWLEHRGIHHNPKTILKAMNKYGLLSVVRRKKYCHYSSALHKYPNILNRNFHTDRPNQKWATDISYIKTAQGFLYLSVIRDLYDNSIISYKTSTNPNVNLVLETVKAAKSLVAVPLTLHSDQGFQYTSREYNKLTESLGITQSMSRRGNPYDNALAENFFSILKTECIHRVKLKTFDEARRLIDDYIYFYNHQRLQLKTKLTPLEKRNQFVA